MPSSEDLTSSQRQIEGVSLLPPSFFVNLINAEPNTKITKSSEKDSLVLQALQTLEEDVTT